MTQPEIDYSYFKEKLQTLADQTKLLVAQVDESSQTVELDQNRVGRLSRIDALQGQAIAKAGSIRQTKYLLEIKEALRRIEARLFGYCLECDEQISIARLKVDPVIQTCIECATKNEQR